MAGETQTSPAVGRRILLVEDEILICLLIETILSDAGYEVAVANTIEEAMGSIDGEALADGGITLVYGGTTKGLMGVVADSLIDAGGTGRA